ncbi:hypothetical protein KKA53_00720 [Candidatus Dependentiae bacterium]|nr:hypothetical protein [Candidatus Dependentiae bacterium]
MRKRMRNFLFYLFYAVFVMGATTTAVFALRGYCYKKKGSEYVAVACDCSCEPKDMNWERLYCNRCGHYHVETLAPVRPKVNNP